MPIIAHDMSHVRMIASPMGYMGLWQPQRQALFDRPKQHAGNSLGLFARQRSSRHPFPARVRRLPFE